jgi:hypothetical protein
VQLPRIAAKASRDPLGCWLWTGYRDTGSRAHGGGPDGHCTHKQTSWLVHRLVFAELVRPLRPGEQVNHTCTQTLCINPDHLEAVTAKENSQRYALTITHCPHGHEYTPENTAYWGSRKKRMCRECNRIRLRGRA